MSKERNDLSYVNAKAFVEGGDTFTSRNTVINSLYAKSVIVVEPLGVKSEGGIRNNAFHTESVAPAGSSKSSCMACDTSEWRQSYNVGSVSEEFDPTDTSGTR